MSYQSIKSRANQATKRLAKRVHGVSNLTYAVRIVLLYTDWVTSGKRGYIRPSNKHLPMHITVVKYGRSAVTITREGMKAEETEFL